MKVTLDAGHGANTGARANGLIEDKLNLEMVIRIGHYLRLAGNRVQYTRIRDEFIPISSRIQTALHSSCDMLVSIHFNAGPPAARGAECFVVDKDTNSRKLAAGILNEICLLGIPGRGIKPDNRGAHSRLGILRGVYRSVPAVLVESGFITNVEDAALLKNREFQDDLARAISRAIVIYAQQKKMRV